MKKLLKKPIYAKDYYFTIVDYSAASFSQQTLLNDVNYCINCANYTHEYKKIGYLLNISLWREIKL